MHLIGYQESMPWMGSSVLTLADIWPARPTAICIFRHPADAIRGNKSVVGFQQHATDWGGHLFRMPGPFESAERSTAHMNTLRDFLLAA